MSLFLKIEKKINEILKYIKKSLIEIFIYNPLRKKTENLFLNLSSKKFISTINENIILDASWDNPNFWFRFSLFREALELQRYNEIGIIGTSRRSQVFKSLRKLKIKNILDYTSFNSKKNLESAKNICKNLKRPGDILKLDLPYKTPSKFLYDYILKKQRKAFVDITDKNLINYIYFFINCIFFADKIIKKYKPKLIISSHIGFSYFPLVWIALKNNINVVILNGLFGTLRFWKITSFLNVFNYQDKPSFKDYNVLSENDKKKLQKMGIDYLYNRFNGKTNDLGSAYAYKLRKTNINKKEICSRFYWSTKKKVICIYASNWFDQPHAYGMSFFRDFYDWMTSTINSIKMNSNVNWLFKAHPIDDWYGGITLNDIINFENLKNINLVPKNWSSIDLINSIDGVITYHGTIGVEATAMGKPVLVADKGWYHDWNFVKVPKSRKDYLDLLLVDWWKSMNIENNKILAQIFAGLYWCKPIWQKDFILDDDPLQWEIYKRLPGLINKNMDVIRLEINNIREWFNSNFHYYHTYKMMKAEDYIV